jgi:hypothetical protein
VAEIVTTGIATEEVAAGTTGNGPTTTRVGTITRNRDGVLVSLIAAGLEEAEADGVLPRLTAPTRIGLKRRDLSNTDMAAAATEEAAASLRMALAAAQSPLMAEVSKLMVVSSTELG